MSKKQTELLRVVEVARALAVSKDTVRRLIALPAEEAFLNDSAVNSGRG